MSDSSTLDDSNPGMIEYLQAARLSVDYVFGEGFAIEHPEMVGIAALNLSIEHLTMSGLLKVSDAISALGIDSGFALHSQSDEYWKVSKLAATDKAEALGIDIKPEWDINDLRYKIDCVLRGVADE